MNKKITLVVFGLCILLTIKSQEIKVHQSFENLVEIKLQDFDDVSIKYDPTISQIIAKKIKELETDYNNTFPDVYSVDCEGEHGWVILKTKLDRKTDKYYYITFMICPDTEFYIYEDGNKEPIDKLYALNLVVTGNGVIYTSGHMGNFNVRRKFEFSNGKFVEVEQPYYYVGLKSKTLNTVNIYQTKECKKLIATLPKNYEIEILLTDSPFTPNLYLVRTSFGLVGWAKLKSGQYESIDVEGLFYNND
jgi:hypothetical protein